MKLLELFNPVNSEEIIKQIHNEFDTASERLLLQADKAIQELNLPLQSEIEKKADRLLKVGFVSSELVKRSHPIKEQRKKTNEIVKMLKEEAELIKYYQKTYPFQKFLTEDELNRICDKYNLIHAPIANYKMDVPDENLKHIEQLQPLKLGDIKKTEYEVKFEFYKWSLPEQKSLYGTIKLGELKDGEDYYLGSMINVLVARRMCIPYFSVNSTKLKEIKKQGLFIAAPKNEFDLTGLDKNSKYGWTTIFEREIKDPIVFEYLRGNIIRVVTKWGLPNTEDKLTNPINN